MPSALIWGETRAESVNFLHVATFDAIEVFAVFRSPFTLLSPYPTSLMLSKRVASSVILKSVTQPTWCRKGICASKSAHAHSSFMSEPALSVGRIRLYCIHFTTASFYFVEGPSFRYELRPAANVANSLIDSSPKMSNTATSAATFFANQFRISIATKESTPY